MRTRTVTTFLLLTTALLAMGAPPPATDERFESWLAELQMRVTSAGGADETTALRAEAMSGLDFSTLGPAHVARLWSLGLLNYSTADHNASAAAQLEHFVDDEGVKGAGALAMRAVLSITMEQSPREQVALMAPALEHPRIADAVSQGYAPWLFLTLRYGMSRGARETLAERLLALEGAFTPDMALDNYTGFDGYFQALAEAIPDRADDLRRVHAKLLETANAITQRTDLVDAFGDNAESYSQLTITMLEKSAEMLELIGASAPDIDFYWTNSGDGLDKLSDLRGKVVVVDFWATWCAPCIASFPRTRELVEHYKGYDVAIVGVTDFEGTIHLPSGPVEAESKDHEVELTKTFAQDFDMTWTVAIAKELAYKSDYGVNLLPQAAIIAPDGTLRYRGLHPGAPIEEKIAKIDALLKEAGLRAPAAPRGD